MVGFHGRGSISGTISEAPFPDCMPTRRTFHSRHRSRQLRKGQKILVQELLPEIEISTASTPLDPSQLFEDHVRDIWLEIGFGGGEHLASQAIAYPHVGLIGCEPFINGVAKLLRWVSEQELGNIRLYCDDARLLLERLPPCSIGRVFILFPDPWPKTRHHKRRIICEPVLARLAEIMKDGAELRIATDDRGYLEWIMQRLFQHPSFEWSACAPEDWRDRPADWPPTRYETKALEQGRHSTYLRYLRRLRPSQG